MYSAERDRNVSLVFVCKRGGFFLQLNNQLLKSDKLLQVQFCYLRFVS